MVPAKLLPYCFGLSILFLVCHAIVLMLKLNDGLIFAAILLSMGVTQYFAFVLLKNGAHKITFKSIFSTLSITQLFSIFLLTIYSAYNPFEEKKPINFEEVISSVLLFGLLMPLLVTSIIWFTRKKELGQT